MKDLEKYHILPTTKRSSNLMLSFLIISLIFSAVFAFSLNNSTQSTSKLSSIDGSSYDLQTLSSAAPYSLDWTKTWGIQGATYYEMATGLDMDSDNNIYVASYYYPGVGTNRSALLAKYDTSGTQLWNRTWGGSKTEIAKDLVVDHSNNIYVVGHTTSFGSINSYDIFVVKYDSNGVQLWNATWGGYKDEWAQSVAVDVGNNVYITGSTRTFSAGDWDIFLVKFDSGGTKQWNVTWGLSEADSGMDIVVDSTYNNIYVCGYTTTAGDVDSKLLKFEPSLGTLLWNVNWGGDNSDYGNAIGLDSNDLIYVTGMTASYIYGIQYLFVTKYYPNNTQIWSRVWGYQNGITYGQAMTLDSEDNIYISGFTSCPTSGTEKDACIVKYDSDGNQPWFFIWGPAGEQQCSSILIDSSENLYITGLTAHTDPASYDAFLVKFTPSESTGIPVFQIPLILATLYVLISWLISRNKIKYNPK